MAKRKTHEETKEEVISKIKVTEFHNLPCSLTLPERAEAAQELANVIYVAESLELEKKSTMAGFKSRMDCIKERIHNLSRKVKDGIEIRPVDCELQLNHTKMTAILIRLDTQEIIEERPLTAEEKQLNFSDF